MTKLQHFWKEVRALQETFDGDQLLVSLEDPRRGLAGGVASLMEPETAARAILNKTHRLASEKEAEEHKQGEIRSRAQIMRREMLRDGKQPVLVGPSINRD